ncbi:hypothetical protein [Weissella confusa]|nr:hypothetical protein [Weissella confusa]
MGVTAKQMKQYAKDHGYLNWFEFRKDVGPNEAREALKQIELDDHA